MRLQVVADQAGNKHTGDSRNRGKGGSGSGGRDAGPSRGLRCAPFGESQGRARRREPDFGGRLLGPRDRSVVRAAVRVCGCKAKAPACFPEGVPLSRTSSALASVLASPRRFWFRTNLGSAAPSRHDPSVRWRQRPRRRRAPHHGSGRRVSVEVALGQDPECRRSAGDTRGMPKAKAMARETRAYRAFRIWNHTTSGCVCWLGSGLVPARDRAPRGLGRSRNVNG
jgi:hypothetical protein